MKVPNMVKKIVAAILAAAVVISAIPAPGLNVSAASEAWDGRTSEEFESGTGTSEDPYIIANGAQLYYLSLQATKGAATEGKHYKLKNDINLNNTPFTPLEYFKGTLDGDGHSITGLNVQMPSDKNAGLIMSGTGCTIKNLKLFGSVSGDSSSGGFFGVVNSSAVVARIEGCENYCTVSGNNAGGFAGTGRYDVTIVDCINNGIVIGKNAAGGIVGIADTSDDSHVKIQRCVNKASVSSDYCAGGIVGRSGLSDIQFSANVCSIYAGSYAGGMIGYGIGVKNTVNYGGGISTYYSRIKNCYNNAVIYGLKKAGGLIGSEGEETMSCCYNVGKVFTDPDGTSADIAYTDHPKVTDCYYLAGLNSSAKNAKGAGNSEVFMKAAAGYSGFDFSTVWTWDSTNAYPYPVLKDLGTHLPKCAHQKTAEKIESTDIANGSYVLVEECSMCGSELKRKTVEITDYSIRIADLPDKLTYLEARDELDTTGGVIEIDCGEIGVFELEITEDMVTGFDNTQVGTQKLTVTYRTATATFDVEVTARSLTGIEIESSPDKLTYRASKENLDTSGGRLRLIYDNDTTETVDITEDMVTGFDNTTAGSQTLTVTYEGYTATYSVEVVAVIPGDVNSDGKVNMIDSTLLRRWLAGWSDVSINEANADVSGDGKVTMIDSTLLRRYLAGWDSVTLE